MKKVFFSVLVAGTFAFASCSQPAVEEAETTSETTVTEESTTTTTVDDSLTVETATGMDTTTVPGAAHGAAASDSAGTPAQ